ncbi:ATP-binding protein [Streptomyces ovatisporus]|uniref:ATP-binding protein n=1 Tax=Streptomyces ovatisporus TaxID=1128682 RepID=A0ABV9A3T4_9ACTN
MPRRSPAAARPGPPSAPPSVPPSVPSVPPGQAPAPAAASSLADWLRTPRPDAEPGIWRYGYRPLPPPDPDRIPARQLLSGAVVSFLIGWLIWSLLYNGYLGAYWLWPMLALTPESWREAGGEQMIYVWVTYAYYALVIGAIAVVFGRLGRWPEVFRRARARLTRTAAPDAGARGAARTPQPVPPPPPEHDPVEWPELRVDGAVEAAERLAGEVRGGRMNDVDHARIRRAWESVRARPGRLAPFVDTVLAHGAAACAHPSGQRGLPQRRAARHDLRLRQVRIGTAADTERNPHQYRGAGVALEPSLLGTSALTVGPPASGKTERVVRPVTESLCLQALAGQAAVVVVTAHGARLAPDESFDAVVRVGHPDSRHGLDLYGGTSDPDEAAGMLAEALVGDLAGTLPGGDSRRAATTLAQLIGPYRAAHGCFPAVPQLRELLDGSPSALSTLRAALEEAAEGAQLRELDAHERQSGRSDDPRPLLADRIALLDRPAFAGFFQPEGGGGPGGSPSEGPRPFSLRALERPLRVRIDLPERGHAEASRILARLVLAQFTECAAARGDQSLFAGLVLDDASQTVTPQSLRGLQRLRSAHAGVLLTLRGLDDVPQSLRGSLLGAVGCRMVCAGVTPWDAEHFAEVWGKEWVETRDVTNRQLVSDEPFTRVMHAVRRLATGRHVTAESVTVRKVQRERWSASELANDLPPGHAVLSLMTVGGERTPPILAKLGE